jgi:uncharacterized protein
MLDTVSKRLSDILNISEQKINNTITLIDEGATIPFIARYRKEVTGGLSDEELRNLMTNLTYIRELDDRRNVIINSITEQAKMTDELLSTIYKATNKTELEDIYLPYKPKRRTKAQIAKEAGLEPFALWILNNQLANIDDEATKYIDNDKGIGDHNQAMDGARHILMELFAENANIMGKVRDKLTNESIITSRIIEGQEDIGIKYKDYFDYQENVKTIPSHRALAIFRGSHEGILNIKIDYPELFIINNINSYENIIIEEFEINLTNSWLINTSKLCFKAKIFPKIETEIINNIRDNADDEAIKVFANNLKNLLLQSPAGGRATLGLDPGIRTGVKVAVIDNTSQVKYTTTIYPYPPKNEYDRSINILAKIIEEFNIELIAIGNGTASRETDSLCRDLVKQYPHLNITPVIVSEAGASVYSASEYASRELPELDVTLRGAVSIARRLQDPMAELIKIDPKSIGVGQYQHDVNQSKLATSLDNTLEDCVNKVGVNLNTASEAILKRISGLNTVIATNIIKVRNKMGKFTNREQLKQVPRIGDKIFQQCAGFLRIIDGDNKLDGSALHPESYPLVAKILEVLKVDIDDLIGNSNLLNKINPQQFVTNDYGIPTIIDAIKELEKPGLDPRGEFKTAKFDDKINTINDLVIGITLEGVVTNVANFGAFIDIGVHMDGLVHISELTNKYITNPSEVVKVGQIVKVKVIEIDKKRNRISLSMKLSTNNSKTNNKIAKPITQDNNTNGTMFDAFNQLFNRK